MNHAPAPVAANPAGEAKLPTRAMLTVLLVGASLAFSMAFACATPFAALAAVAVSRLKRIDAFVAVTLAWLVNQADGFLFMHYPRTWETVGWGVAIWLAAMAATFGASALSKGLSRPAFVASAAALAGAFVAYEGVLWAATFALPASQSAFSPVVVVRLLATNAVAFALLLALIGLVGMIGARLSSGALPTVAPTR